MERVPNIEWKTLEEARTHFNKLPDLTRVISTPLQPKVLFVIVPHDWVSFAKETYGSVAEIVPDLAIYEDTKPLIWEDKKVPYWQQINRRKR